MGRKPKNIQRELLQKTKKCLACPPHKNERPIGNFYLSHSPMHQDGRVPWCKSCIIRNSTSETGEIDEECFKVVLRQIDKPFYYDYLQSAIREITNELLDSNKVKMEDIKYQGAKIIRRYFKNIQSLPQLSRKTYGDSEKDNVVSNGKPVRISIFGKKDLTENVVESVVGLMKENKTNWTDKDLQNKKYAISTIGYDPFEEASLTERDKKYGYNILAGYCDTEGITEDGHKIQSVIEISMLYIQVRKLTEAMNKELTGIDLDDAKIQKLVSSKTSLLASIATIAKDNNIASNYNKNSRQGKDSLTSKIKEMEDSGFKDIEVNLFDIKTSEAFKQIDEISNNNIATQLSLDNSEYSEIVKEQREKIIDYQDRIEALEEENRILKNKIIYYESDLDVG